MLQEVEKKAVAECAVIVKEGIKAAEQIGKQEIAVLEKEGVHGVESQLKNVETKVDVLFSHLGHLSKVGDDKSGAHAPQGIEGKIKALEDKLEDLFTHLRKGAISALHAGGHHHHHHDDPVPSSSTPVTDKKEQATTTAPASSVASLKDSAAVPAPAK